MPYIKNRMIFISHAWNSNEQYWTIVNWLNEETNFSWSNCSIPSHDGLSETTSKGLSEGMTRQISPAQVVILIGGMYAVHSNWIDYEIQEAQRMGKTIIGVRPWKQLRVPVNVQNASTKMVGWNRASIINAVRLYT